MGWQYKEKMKKRAALLIILSLATTILGSSAPQTRIEIKDNWYYLNGQKFFIKALGYEIGARPGQHPYKGVQADDLDLMKFDLRVIKEAGYNTIRTWSPFTEPQLKLAQGSGLKVIMGVDVDHDKDYGDPKFIKDCEDNLKKVLSYAKKYDCIITYLLINEPQTDQKTGQSSLLTQTGA
jgi:beta-galactosidase/beta-glucuronidase